MDTLIYFTYNSPILWKSTNSLTGTICVTFLDHMYRVPYSLLEFNPDHILMQATSEQLQSYPEGIVVLKGDGSLFKLILSLLLDDGNIIYQGPFWKRHSWMSSPSMASILLIPQRFSPYLTCLPYHRYGWDKEIFTESILGMCKLQFLS